MDASGRKQVVPARLLGFVAGLAAVFAAFLPWTTVVPDETRAIESLTSFFGWMVERLEANGWDSTPATVATVSLAAAAVVAVLPLFGRPVPAGSAVWLALVGISVAAVIVAWGTAPDLRDAHEEFLAVMNIDEPTSTRHVVEMQARLRVEPGVGRYLGVTAAGLSLAAALVARSNSRAATWRTAVR